MQGIGRDPLLRQPALQIDRKQDIRSLGLPVRHDAVIPVLRLTLKRPRQRLDVPLLGRDLVVPLRQVIVREARRRDALREAGERDHAGGAGRRPRLLGGVAKQREKEVGEQEGTDVVRPELELDSLRCRLARVHHHGGIVDEDVERVGQSGYAGGGGADGLLGGEVEEDRLDWRGWVFVADIGGYLFELGLRTRGEDEKLGGLRSEGEGGGLAYAVWTDASDEDWGCLCCVRFLGEDSREGIDRIGRGRY